jgi:hypothetical protein
MTTAPAAAAFGAKISDTDAVEIELVEHAHLVLLAAKDDLAAGGARARERVQAPHRESPLLQDPHHGLTDEPGRPDDGDVISFRHHSHSE